MMSYPSGAVQTYFLQGRSEWLYDGGGNIHRGRHSSHNGYRARLKFHYVLNRFLVYILRSIQLPIDVLQPHTRTRHRTCTRTIPP